MYVRSLDSSSLTEICTSFWFLYPHVHLLNVHLLNSLYDGWGWPIYDSGGEFISRLNKKLYRRHTWARALATSFVVRRSQPMQHHSKLSDSLSTTRASIMWLMEIVWWLRARIQKGEPHLEGPRGTLYWDSWHNYESEGIWITSQKVSMPLLMKPVGIRLLGLRKVRSMVINNTPLDTPRETKLYTTPNDFALRQPPSL